jgi:hypothetical protein
MTNGWYHGTESKRIAIADVPQEKKFYVDVAVLAAKKHFKVAPDSGLLGWEGEGTSGHAYQLDRFVAGVMSFVESSF